MKVQLYSGGMDSWLIDKLWKPDIKLFFDIGTKNNKQELEKIKKRNDVRIIKLPLSQFEQVDNNYFLPLRNLHFVLYASHFGDEICIGATGSSTHKDKNETFATLAENTINYLLSETNEKPVKIVMPYLNKSKTEMLAEFINQGGDINKCFEESFSCYNPINGNPCMVCTSCLSRFTAFYNNGYPFTQEQIKSFLKGARTVPIKADVKELVDKLTNKQILIDFDNTITENSKYPETGNLRKGCKEKLNQFKKDGYQLVLYTSRKGADFEKCVKFCKENDLPLDKYIQGKPNACCYIDDKAIRFTNWKKIEIPKED